MKLVIIYARKTFETTGKTAGIHAIATLTVHTLVYHTDYILSCTLTAD